MSHQQASQEEVPVPDKRPSVKNEKQYEALKEKGMSKERAAKIANSPGASSRGGKKSGSGVRRRTTSQGGTTAQKKAAGRKGGKATARSARREIQEHRARQLELTRTDGACRRSEEALARHPVSRCLVIHGDTREPR